MKRLLLLVLTTINLTGFAQGPSTDPRLAGIVNVEGLKLAIIQTPPPRLFELALGERQRDGGVEVVTIDSTNRSVTARFSTNLQPRVLALGNESSSYHDSGVTFEGVRLQTVLDLLAQFSGRIILQHPRLPDIRFSFASALTNRNEAAQVLKNALLEKRIAVVPDGSRFLLVAPEEMISVLKPRSAGTATTNTTVKAELLPPGSINFTGAPLGSVLMIYAEFLGGKLDRTAPPLPDGKVVFKMPTALTKEESLYALETLVGWHGIKLVSTETGLFKAVSTD